MPTVCLGLSVLVTHKFGFRGTCAVQREEVVSHQQGLLVFGDIPGSQCRRIQLSPGETELINSRVARKFPYYLAPRLRMVSDGVSRGLLELLLPPSVMIYAAFK